LPGFRDFGVKFMEESSTSDVPFEIRLVERSFFPVELIVKIEELSLNPEVSLLGKEVLFDSGVKPVLRSL